MPDWLGKYFDLKDFPSLGSGVVGAVGSTIGGVFGGPPGSIIGGVAGVLLGQLGGTALAPSLAASTSTRKSARMKLTMDFDHSVLHQQHAVQIAAEECNERLDALEVQGQVHVEGRTPADEIPFIPIRRHLVHPTQSTSEDDLTLQQFAEALRAEFTDEHPLLVNCACINAACSAVLKSLIRNYHLNIKLDSTDEAGLYQVAKIDRDPDERADFTVCAESPFFLHAGRGTLKYRRMFPIHSENQRVFTKVTKRSQLEARHSAVAIFDRSSAAEQLFLRLGGIRENSEPLTYRRLDDLDAIVEALRPGEQIILWEPMATRFGARLDLTKSDEVFPVWISMFCHQRWRSNARRPLKAKFVRLFIDEWNYCLQNRDWAFSMLRNDPEWLHWFSLGAGLTKSS